MASSYASNFGLKDSSLIKTQGFIDGKWREAKDKSTFAVKNPATNQLLADVSNMGAAETKEAIAAAKEAFKTWSQTTARERHDILVKLYRLMMEHHDDLGRLITLENGKPLADGKGENQYSAMFFEWFAEEALRQYGETIPSHLKNLRSVTIRQPIGVCGIITPWNFPSAMITRKVGPALAAGCTVVIKTPPETPFSALAIAELSIRAGVPPGVINVITSGDYAKEIGKELCESPDVRKVSFTGSTPVGKILYSQSASTMKKLSLELGGNAPFIVFDDANVDEAVEGAIVCKFRQTGQTCVCANRVYVQEGIHAEFAAKFAEKVANFKTGNGLEPSVTHGPLIHSRAVDKVETHVNDAVSKGAQVLTGGKRLEGNFFEPTVLSDVTADAQCLCEETFGPLAPIVKFKTEEDVIRMANDTRVGLAGYMFSRDVGRCWRVAEALEVGMVGINTGVVSSVAIPFGGIKESGLGREGGKQGIDEYTQIKYLAFGGI